MSIKKNDAHVLSTLTERELKKMTMGNIRKTSIQHFIDTVRLLQKKHLISLTLDEEDTLKQFNFYSMHDDFYTTIQNSFLATTIQERIHRFLKICGAIYLS